MFSFNSKWYLCHGSLYIYYKFVFSDQATGWKTEDRGFISNKGKSYLSSAKQSTVSLNLS